MSTEILLENAKNKKQSSTEHRVQFIKNLFASLDNQNNQTNAAKLELFYYLHRQLDQNYQTTLVKLLKITEEEVNDEIKILKSIGNINLGNSNEIENHVIETLIDKKIPEAIGPEGMAILEILNLCSFKKRPWLSSNPSQEKSLADKQRHLKNMINELHENRKYYENQPS